MRCVFYLPQPCSRIQFSKLNSELLSYFEGRKEEKKKEEKKGKREKKREKKEKRKEEICFQISSFKVIKHSEPSERAARRTCERRDVKNKR